MIGQILEARNRGILRDVHMLLPMLRAAEAPDELRPYRERIEGICQEVEARANRHLEYLSLRRQDIIPDILSGTTLLTRLMELLGGRLAPPILRASQTDRLSLITIGWLHRCHPQTQDYPPAFIDGDVATWPFLRLGTPLYFFPSVEQRGLLYQPLYFHEFGHVLYACHKPELDALVGELQRAIYGALVPASQRNDRHAGHQARNRQLIVDTWYKWAQELFCDAVGFTIGGPCFLRAFSSYLSHLAETDFYLPADDLAKQQHPVTWLRIHFLARRAARCGFPQVAQQVTDEWNAIAATLGVYPDYHGYYVDTLQDAIDRALADMLTETSPRSYTQAEAVGGGWSPTTDTPIRLLNWAWQILDAQPDSYVVWESNQIALLLNVPGV